MALCAQVPSWYRKMALRLLTALGFASLATAAPKSEGLHKRWLETRGETLFNVFKRDGESTSLAYVENSGICVCIRSKNEEYSLASATADKPLGDD